MQGSQTYTGAIDHLQCWYSSDDEKSVILTEWQQVTLSKAMSPSPSMSGVSVFREFDARLMSLQKQLDMSYSTDLFFRDRLLTFTDISSVQYTLSYKVLSTRQRSVNCIANQLSDKSRSACSSSALTAYKKEYYGENDDLYSLGKTFGGDTRRQTRSKWRPQRGGSL